MTIRSMFALLLATACAAPAFAQTSAPATPSATQSTPAPEPSPVSVSAVLSNFASVGLSGDGDNDILLGGRVDLFATVALSDRTSITFHPEVIYGESANLIGGGPLLPTNTAMLLPSNGDEDFDLSISVTQKIGSRASVTFGKINLLDLAAKSPIIGGGGIDGFQHIALAAPPSGLVPPSLIGAIFSVPTDNGIFSLWIYDPVGTTNRTGFEDMFGSGVAALASATFPVTIGGLPGYQNIKVAANTKTGFDLNDLPELLLPPGTSLPGQRQGAWNLTYSFQQFLWVNPERPGTGWGVFGQLGVSDGNPTPLDWSGLIGISGTISASRPDDRFGIAYFRQSFSDVLVDVIAPVVGLGDEQGVEAFYTIGIGGAFKLTADIQYIDPALAASSAAVVAGMRLVARF